LVVVVTMSPTGAGLDVWSIWAVMLLPVPDSVAVRVQNPVVIEGVYVVPATPREFVVAEVGLTAPQAAAGVPLKLKVTVSPEM
jgi:hypothetical protein